MASFKIKRMRRGDQTEFARVLLSMRHAAKLFASMVLLTAGAVLAVIEAMAGRFLGFVQSSPTWFIQQPDYSLDAVGQDTLFLVPIRLIVALALLIAGARLMPRDP